MGLANHLLADVQPQLVVALAFEIVAAVSAIVRLVNMILHIKAGNLFHGVLRSSGETPQTRN